MATPIHPHWQNDLGILNAARNAPPLKQGATGTGVQRLREALQVMGAPTLPEALTTFGSQTKGQLETFQRLYSLSPDGVAGGNTIGKLDELLALPPVRRKPWPPAAAAANSSREPFLQDIARECGPVVRALGQGFLPVSAMMACAAVESGWGTGPIYRETKNLFSMQKWPWVPYPSTGRTLWRTTVIQTNPIKTAKAPFNTATDLADAARQWCEWILKYGEADGPPGSQVQNPRPAYAGNASARARRETLKGMRNDPVLFAKNLYLVSFGESAAHGQRYASVLTENHLTRFD